MYLRPILFSFFCLILLVNTASATVGVPFDPAEHPDFFIVDGFLDKIPIKNQASSPEWVKEINGSFDVKFTHIPIPRSSSFKCLSYGVSSCVDWWLYQLGEIEEFPAYQSFTHGGREYGVNPREIEAQYYARAKANEQGFFLLPYPAMDSYTHERIPYNLEAYCRLVAEPKPAANYEDPALGSGYAVHKGKDWYGMDRAYEVVFKHNAFGNSETNEKRLREALLDHGPCYGGVEFSMPFGLSVHVICIVGFGKINGETWFVYRESFGDGKVGPDTGEPPFRMCHVDRINEAYAFPHELRHSFAEAIDGDGYLLSIFNQRGNAVDPDKLDVSVTGECPSFSYEHEAVGLYRFRSKESSKSTWQLNVGYEKRYFVPASGEPYVVQHRFRGNKTVEDDVRRRFRRLY